MIFTNKFAERLKHSYDLRSTEIEIEDAKILGKSFGSELIFLKKKNVCIGHDRRSLSKFLYDAFIDGLISVGIDVFALGECGTPVVQYISVVNKFDSAVCVTASHNPIEYHGFKFFIDNFSFFGDSLEKIILRGINNDFYDSVCKGKLTEISYQLYIDFLNEIKIQNKFKVGWDLLNGCAGNIIGKLNISKNDHILNEEKKNNFGGYAPDPGCLERLHAIIELEKKKKVDFAFLIDGDADRTVLLFNNQIISGDVLLGIFVYLEFLIKQSDLKIVWDDISSLSIKKWCDNFGENFISKTGHSFIQNLAIKKDCFLAGELSGHYMFKDIFFIDDGIYASLRLVEYLEKLNVSLEDIFKVIPKVYKEKLKNITCKNFEDQKEKFDDIKKYLISNNIKYTEFDGIKIFSDDSCLSLRQSNTECLIRVVAEGNDEIGLKKLETFYSNMLIGLSR